MVNTISVLWWKHSNGDAGSVERVYEDDERAKEDFELVKKDSSREWELTEVPYFRSFPSILTEPAKAQPKRKGKPRVSKNGLGKSPLSEAEKVDFHPGQPFARTA